MKIRDYARHFRRWVENGSAYDSGVGDSPLETQLEAWIFAYYGNSSTATYLREEREKIIDLIY